MSDIRTLSARLRRATAGPQSGGARAVATDGAAFDARDALRQAVIHGQRDATALVTRRMLAAGITRADIADCYVPELARQLGDEWQSDDLSFTQVTIGTARLQSILRTFGQDWSAAHDADPQAPSLILMSPKRTDHTLGIMVLAGQLRRKGLSVRLMLDAEPCRIALQMQQFQFDAAFISISVTDDIEPVRAIVDAVRAHKQVSPPVIVGGSILDRESPARLADMTGADYATKQLDEALRFCGLETKITNGASQTRRS